MFPKLHSFIRPLMFPNHNHESPLRVKCIHLDFEGGALLMGGGTVEAYTVPQMASNLLATLSSRVYLNALCADELGETAVRKNFACELVQLAALSPGIRIEDVVFDDNSGKRWVQVESIKSATLICAELQKLKSCTSDCVDSATAAAR